MTKLPVPMPPPGEMLRRRIAERKYRMVLRRLCLGALALCVLLSQLLLPYRQRGLGMYPMVQNGDLVVANRLRRDCGKGDLVLYRMEGRVYLGRIAAVEGEEVMMDESGQLLVNGCIRNEGILYPTYGRPGASYPQRVPEGMVYILGDHRTQSWDSRDHGCVRKTDILGRIIGILRTRQL